MKLSPRKSNLFMLLFLVYNLPAQIFLLLILGALVFVTKVMPGIAYIQFFSSVLLFGGFILIYRLVTKKPLSQIMPIKPLKLSNIALIIGITIFLVPAMMFLSAVSMLFSENIIGGLLHDSMFQSGLGVALLVFAVTPAILEETLMRGIIMDGYKGIGLFPAALMNGLLFAIMHTNIQQFLYAFMLGIVFVLMVHYTGSILASVISHFSFNAINVLMASASTEPAEELTRSELIETIISIIPYVAVTLLIAIGLFSLLKRVNNKKGTSIFTERYLGHDNNMGDNNIEVDLVENSVIQEEKPIEDIKDLEPSKKKAIIGWEILAIIAVYVLYVIDWSKIIAQ